MPLEIPYQPFTLPPEPAPRAAAPVDAASAAFDAAVRAATKSTPPSSATGRSLLGRLRATSLGQRVAGIAAIGLVGATLGAIGWGTAGISAARAEAQSGGLEPFERPGASFPGSAFYYLDPHDSGLVAPSEAARIAAGQGDEAARLAAIGTAPIAGGAGPFDAGPIARPTFFAGTGEDRARALQCLTAAIYYEAASEPDPGQRAVAQVVLNRVAHPAFPKSVCGVVYQGSERPGCQFSFACDGSLARRPVPQFWDRARRVAADALAGNVFAPVGLSTHYHTSAVHPAWDAEMQLVDVIGAHRFFRWPGLAGRPSSFGARYAGGEPLPAPHARAFAPPAAPDLAADPIALARAFEEGRLAALRAAQPAGEPVARLDQPAGAFGQQPRKPAPDYAPALAARGGDAVYRADGLPGSGGVRPEYQNSGRWIAKPGE